MSDTQYPCREAWLAAILPDITDWCLRAASQQGIDVEYQPVPFVSVGWPKRGKRETRAQVWYPQIAGARAQIFVSPTEDDGVEVVGCLIHEIIHTIAGKEAGHRGAFRTIAQAVGLEGKMTATTPGSDLLSAIQELVAERGPYPHEALAPSAPGEKQKTRYRKWICPICGQIVRAATDVLHAYCGGDIEAGEQHDIAPFEMEEQ